MNSIEYFSGLFDGEGTVGIYAVGNGRKTNSGNKVYWVGIKFGSL